MFDERVFQILDFQNCQGRGLKITPIEQLIAPDGGCWGIGDGAIAPCGCRSEVVRNSPRLVFFCPKHPEHGLLIEEFREGRFYWTDGKLEEVKK